MTKTGAMRALGTMSGTSLDGVDAAVVVTDGVTISSFGDSGYRPYAEDERQKIRDMLGAQPGDPGTETVAEIVETAHAALLAGFQEVDVVGFHGQTLAHDPSRTFTYQAGDGSILTEVLGLPVVWDFRTMDVEMGGQGAPLAPFFHHACARWIGADAPLTFLNLGGVGNLTWIDPGKANPAEPGALLAFDTGPANAPIDDLIFARRGEPCDRDGALAATGKVADGVLEAMLARGYFHKVPPKSLDRGEFDFLQDAVADLADADAAATLTAAAAAAVMQGMEHCPVAPDRMLVTGGGRKNPVLMGMLAAALDCPVEPVEAAGLDGDMLEAQAFAFLAVRVLNGLPTSAPGTTGVAAPVGGGQVSRPAGQRKSITSADA